jgi:hypothetical protein
MKLFKTLIFSTVLLFALTSCEDFLDVNTDPNAATEVSPDLLFPTVLANVAANRAIEIMPSNAFFVNIWAPNGSTGVFINPDRYIISPFSTGNTWSNWYGTSMRNLTLMIEAAETNEPARPNVAAQAKMMQAYLFFSLTMMWEDIPFTQSQDPEEFPEPEFDDQETVLRGVITMLDEAIAQTQQGEAAVGDGDLIYGGDMDKWVRFANSLKLRTYMFLRNQDTSVDSEIEALLNSAPLIRTNADEASIPFFDNNDNANNLWTLNNLFGGFTDAGNGNIFVYAGETLVDIMNDLDDPRRETYFAFRTDDDGATFVEESYVGQTAGVSGFGGPTNAVSQNIIRRDWPNRMLTASEVLFYEAEFLATTGDLPGAYDAYIAGVRASLDFLAPYTVLDSRAGESDGISEADKDDYIANLPASFTSENQALEAIHTQQYIEVLDRAPENWSHWKRTKFPTLNVAQNADLGDVIRRFPYPPSEISSNPNTPQDPILDTPMWFEN